MITGYSVIYEVNKVVPVQLYWRDIFFIFAPHIFLQFFLIYNIVAGGHDLNLIRDS